MPQPLRKQRDLVPSVDHTLDEHSGIDPNPALVRLGDGLQNLRIRMTINGIQCDHLAARIALEDSNLRLGSDPQRLANKSILRRTDQIEVDIGAKPPLIQCRADL